MATSPPRHAGKASELPSCERRRGNVRGGPLRAYGRALHHPHRHARCRAATKARGRHHLLAVESSTCGGTLVCGSSQRFEQSPCNLVSGQPVVFGHLIHDSAESSKPEGPMPRDSDMVFPCVCVVNRMWLPVCLVSTYPNLANARTRSSPDTSRGSLIRQAFLRVPSEGGSPSVVSASSKWQRTASRTCSCSSSSVSASVKIAGPSARAVQPPSGASSITKMLSFIVVEQRLARSSMRRWG
jgi:hypothetical protein